MNLEENNYDYIEEVIMDIPRNAYWWGKGVRPPPSLSYF